MDDGSGRALDRFGAATGIASVVLLVCLFTVLPGLPPPEKPIGDIGRSALDHRDAHLLGAYLGALLSGALLVFGAAVSAALRRRESASGWSAVALIGAAATSIGIAADVSVITFVRAVGHGATGTMLWVGYGSDHWFGTLLAVPFGVFLLGAGLGGRETEAVPRWLALAAVGLSAVLVAGAASVTGDEVDGGPLGVVLAIGYLGTFVWILATSVVLWRAHSGEVRTTKAVALVP